MSYSISTLLTRNLQEVFGENDPARRRAAVQELYTEDGVFYDASKGVYRAHDRLPCWRRRTRHLRCRALERLRVGERGRSHRRLLEDCGSARSICYMTWACLLSPLRYFCQCFSTLKDPCKSGLYSCIPPSTF